MKDIFLSIGSNIEPRVKYIDEALSLLNSRFNLISQSSIYETQPLMDEQQENFYNMALYAKTEIDDPFLILNIIKDIEKQIGRVKDINRPKGPRVIDIDIIFFDKIHIDTKELTIPHKSLYDRNFVLIPLKEILLNYPSIFQTMLQEYNLDYYIEMNKNQKVVKI